jgi:hypothetical protein
MGRFMASIGHKGAKVMGKHLMDSHPALVVIIQPLVLTAPNLSSVFSSFYLGFIATFTLEQFPGLR